MKRFAPLFFLALAWPVAAQSTTPSAGVVFTQDFIQALADLDLAEQSETGASGRGLSPKMRAAYAEETLNRARRRMEPYLKGDDKSAGFAASMLLEAMGGFHAASAMKAQAEEAARSGATITSPGLSDTVRDYAGTIEGANKRLSAAGMGAITGMFSYGASKVSLGITPEERQRLLALLTEKFPLAPYAGETRTTAVRDVAAYLWEKLTTIPGPDGGTVHVDGPKSDALALTLCRVESLASMADIDERGWSSWKSLERRPDHQQSLSTWAFVAMGYISVAQEEAPATSCEERLSRSSDAMDREILSFYAQAQKANQADVEAIKRQTEGAKDTLSAARVKGLQTHGQTVQRRTASLTARLIKSAEAVDVQLAALKPAEQELARRYTTERFAGATTETSTVRPALRKAFNISSNGELQ